MPRKTNGMPFETFPRPDKGEDGKPLLYVRPQSNRKKLMIEVDGYAARNRGLNPGDMTIMFTRFMDVAGMWLAEGFRIETPLGVFSPKLKLRGEFTDARQITGRDVYMAGIEFTASKQFVSEVLFQQQGFRRQTNLFGKGNIHHEEDMQRALRSCIKRRHFTIQEFMSSACIKYNSAHRYLNNLCEGEHPVLRKEKIGRTYLYFPV